MKCPKCKNDMVKKVDDFNGNCKKWWVCKCGYVVTPPTL